MTSRAAWSYLIGMSLVLSPLPVNADVNWEHPWEVRMNGRLLAVQSFSSHLTPEAVARSLLGQKDKGYERYLLSEGQILLSGIRSGKHHMANIQAAAGGSQGYVSTLWFTEVGASRWSAADHRRTRALPNAQVFAFSSGATVELTAAGPAEGSYPLDVDSFESFFYSFADAPTGMSVRISMPEK